MNTLQRALIYLKDGCDCGYITNLNSFFNFWSLDHTLATVLIGTGVVKKVDGCYRWDDEIEVDDEFCVWLRHWTNEYKNNGISKPI